MRRIIRSDGIEKSINEIINVFFGLTKGELPEKFEDLHKQYLKDISVQGGCSSCRKNAIQKRYKNNILENI